MNSSKPQFSFAISIHDRGPEGSVFLEELLDSISYQYYKNFEVIISDSSNRLDYKKIIDRYKKIININHLNSDQRFLSSNINNALKNCKGKYIKIMFSDDLIISPFMLIYLKIIFSLSRKTWIVLASYDFRGYKNQKINILRGRKPKWNDKILFGENTISGPSVIAFKNFKNNFFDENVILLMDCEFYYRMRNNFGNPYFSSRFYIANRVHINQEQNSISSEEKEEDIEYLKIKYSL
jgi:glycosyltransferase involved in cell wall biosynthesis